MRVEWWHRRQQAEGLDAATGDLDGPEGFDALLQAVAAMEDDRPAELSEAMNAVRSADPLLVDAMAMPLNDHRGLLKVLALPDKKSWLRWLVQWQITMLGEVASWTRAVQSRVVQWARAQGHCVPCPVDEEMVATHEMAIPDGSSGICPACPQIEDKQCEPQQCKYCGACKWAARQHYCPDPGEQGVAAMPWRAHRRQATQAIGAFMRADR